MAVEEDAEADGSAQSGPGGSVLQRRLIERLAEVPAFQGMLTVGVRAIYQVPREFEMSLAAIELGPRRVAILYDPNAVTPQLRGSIQALRSRLLAERYSFVEGGDYPCKSEVIRLLTNDYLAKHGGGDGGSAARMRSQARDRFLGWMETAVREGATDLHVRVVGNGRALVQIRVDGELENLRDERGGVYTETEAIESMAWPFNSASAKGSNSSAQWDDKTDLYCMTEPRVVGDKQISLRYQSLRGYAGPKVVARLLNVDTNAPTLSYQQLGYAESQRALLADVAKTQSGFVLFSGVTGSGKTTTQKSFVETHPGNGKLAIYSIEDPVEYPMRGVHQITMQRDVANKARSLQLYNEVAADLMRSDPDIAIIGEIRDSATASAGQQLVETGHMALGTVHAHLLPGIIPRLSNSEIGMSRDVLTNPNILALLAYQALVPNLCRHCCLTAEAAIDAAQEAAGAVDNDGLGEASHIREIVKLIVERFEQPVDRLRFKNNLGCEHCRHRGTSGLSVVAEMIIPDRTWLEFTRHGKDYEAMVHYRQSSDKRFDSKNMTGKTVFEHTLYKALLGQVDPRNCERFDSFKRFEIAPKLASPGR